MTQEEQPEIPFDEYYSRFLSKRKVHQREFFISVGPGPQPERYYACIMRPATDEEILSGSDEFIVFGKENNRWGHAAADDAKKAAAQRYPTLPVLISGDTYFYPCYESYARKIRVLTQAEDRRRRKKDKLSNREVGTELICEVCKVPFIADWDDKEAWAEFKKNFSTLDPSKAACVCDDCYKKIMPEVVQ